MRLGVILPSFAIDATDAIAAARQAKQAGIHGVFCYDHLWPMGEPGKPALEPFALLGALSALTTSVVLATLVARIGLVPDEVLISEFLTLQELSDGRLIAALGTGDHKSARENASYGAAFEHAEVRRNAMGRVATTLIESGVTVWIGGGSIETNDVAIKTKSTLNLWSASADKVAAAARYGPVSWAGRLSESLPEATEQLGSLERAGATWAVCMWPGAVDPLIDAATKAGVSLGH